MAVPPPPPHPTRLAGGYRQYAGRRSDQQYYVRVLHRCKKNRISFITLMSLSQLQTGTIIILRLANFWQGHCRLVTVPSPMRNVDHTTRSTSTLFKFFSFLHAPFQLIRKDEEYKANSLVNVTTQ